MSVILSKEDDFQGVGFGQRHAQPCFHCRGPCHYPFTHWDGGAELFIRADGNEVEFVTLLRFDSMDAVKKFAGDDEGRPVIFPKAEALLARMERAQHYRIAV